MKKGRKTEASAGVLSALIVGVGQAIATMPGISRSGMTITTGCFVGYERRFAVRFSFLLSIPAVLGANILSLKDAMDAASIGVRCRCTWWASSLPPWWDIYASGC